LNIEDVVNTQVAVIFLIFILALGYMAFNAHESQQSSEYIQGYHDGYTQVDATKYNVASSSVTMFNYPSYAFGYKVGYEDAIKNKKDEILKH
jgi:hypothetical protein